MRAAMLAIVCSAGLVLAADAPAAAPAAGAAVDRLHDAGALAEPVHCRRWLPHRHSGAKPHGFGLGCGLKKPKPGRPRGRSDRPTGT
jgi:hypothetical protein